MSQNAGIIGMGHAYPSGILTNADLEKIVETSDDWITTRTGIKQRHKAADNEYTSQFGTLGGEAWHWKELICSRKILILSSVRRPRPIR